MNFGDKSEKPYLIIVNPMLPLVQRGYHLFQEKRKEDHLTVEGTDKAFEQLSVSANAVIIISLQAETELPKIDQ